MNRRQRRLRDQARFKRERKQRAALKRQRESQQQLRRALIKAIMM